MATIHELVPKDRIKTFIVIALGVFNKKKTPVIEFPTIRLLRWRPWWNATTDNDQYTVSNRFAFAHDFLEQRGTALNRQKIWILVWFWSLLSRFLIMGKKAPLHSLCPNISLAPAIAGNCMIDECSRWEDLNFGPLQIGNRLRFMYKTC